MSDKNMDDKIREYESLLKSRPGDIDVYYELLDLYLKRGLLANFTEKSLNLADIYISNNSLEQAEIVCNRIIKLEPENIKAREKLIEIYISMGNIDEARDTCFFLSRICLMINEPEKFFEFIKKGIELDPDNLDARLEMAIMNVKQGRIKEGIDQYKELGKAYWEKGELIKASETYKRVTVLHPDDTETHLNLGSIYRELGQLEDAKNAFRFILKYDLTNIKVLTELGLVCQEKGEIDSAILAFRKVLDINPVNAEAAGKLGELYLIRGQPEEAVKAYYNGAELYLKQDLKDNAIHMCELILDIDCKFSKALRMIKDLGYKLGYSSPPPPPEPVYNYNDCIECPSCGEKNRSSALMCFFCGLQFENAEQASIYCLHCGAKSKFSDFHCHVCGKEQEQIAPGTHDVDMSFYKITSGTMFATGIKDPLILKYTEIRSHIKGMVADIKVIQKFQNNLDKNIEAFYLFPLPGDGAVYDLEIKAGERTIKGKIKEKEEAKRTYEDAMNDGRKASLLEDQKENIFNISVANIKPGEEILVTLKYYQTVKYDDGEYEFVIPLVISHKSGEMPGEATYGKRGEINIFINLDAGFPVGEVKSPTHLLYIEEKSEHIRNIQLAKEGEIPNKDFILKYSSTGERLETSLSFYKKEGKPGAFMLHVTPKMDYGPEEMVKREMIFILDRSGSMSWGKRNFTPIDQARKALKACLRTLRSGDMFNIITFSTYTNNIHYKSLAFNDVNLKNADDFIDSIHATGGTNILMAIKQALRHPVEANYLRQIIFLTDGEVKNVDEILSAIHCTLGKSRIFTFGIGTTVNRNLLDGMAEMGKGTVQYLTLEQDIEEAIQKFSNQTAFPILTDISLEWENASVSDIYPMSISDLYFGQVLYLLGRFHSAGKSKAILKGMTVSGNFTQEIDVELPAAAEEYPVVEIMWAKKRIDYLLKKEKENPKEKHSIREEIIGISMRYKILTPYTSFVAVEEGCGSEREEIIRVTVPQLLPEGMKKTLPGRTPVPQTPSPSSGKWNLVSPPGMMRRSVSPVMKTLSPSPSLSRSAGRPTSGIISMVSPQARNAGRPMSGIMNISVRGASNISHPMAPARNTPVKGQSGVMRLNLSSGMPSSEEIPEQKLLLRSEETSEESPSVRVEEYRGNIPDIAVVDFSPGGKLSLEDEKCLLSEIEEPVKESTLPGSVIASEPSQSPVSPEMIDLSFRYLARNQSAEGFWSNEPDINKRVISTALAVLAFIKHGHTNKAGNYRGQLSKAIYYIQNNLNHLSGVALSLSVMMSLELYKISQKKKEREDSEKAIEKLKEEWSSFNTVLEKGFASHAGKNAVKEGFIKEGELSEINTGEGEIKNIKITVLTTVEDILSTVLSVISGEKESVNLLLKYFREDEPDRGSINIAGLNPVDTTAIGIFVIA
ncbi:MAG: VIT domain-containing protein [Candidatus Eremiobacterota bacterium]